jgi:hypothetical protein
MRGRHQRGLLVSVAAVVVAAAVVAVLTLSHHPTKNASFPLTLDDYNQCFVQVVIHGKVWQGTGGHADWSAPIPGRFTIRGSLGVFVANQGGSEYFSPVQNGPRPSVNLC